MKKLLLILAVVALASFLAVGCIPTTPGGEGEGEGEVEEVTVEIEDAVTIGGKTYVSADEHDITVTFPAPVEGNVNAYIGLCGGDYSSKGLVEDLLSGLGLSIVLFPNEDRTIWTGSGDFTGGDDCCASYVSITAGECEDDVCIQFPVIVDSEPPEATIELCLDDCVCDGCTLTFKSTSKTVCDVTTENCGDYCSGLASWSIAVFDFEGYEIGETPYDKCCEVPCDEPIFTCSGTACPINCTTSCLKQLDLDNGIFAVVTLVDNVGNDVKWGTYVSTCDYDTCSQIQFVPYTSGPAIDNECLDDAADVFTPCKDNTVCPL